MDRDIASLKKSKQETLGHKRTCGECGTKYYDFNKEQPLCPKCGAVYREEEKPLPKPARKARKPTLGKTENKEREDLTEELGEESLYIDDAFADEMEMDEEGTDEY